MQLKVYQQKTFDRLIFLSKVFLLIFQLRGIYDEHILKEFQAIVRYISVSTQSSHERTT